MKNNNPILFFTLALLLCGCNNTINENQLIGNWQVVDFNANTPSVSTEIIELARLEALSSKYFFKKNKDYTLKTKSISEQGTWKLDIENKKIIFINIVKGEEKLSYYTLEYLNKNSIKFIHTLEKVGSISMTLQKEIESNVNNN